MDNKVYIYHTDADYESIKKNRKQIGDFLLSGLKSLIKPGDKVILKPNFVKESHMKKKEDWEYIITHTEVIRMVLEYVDKLLCGKGEINIVDAPQTDSDYEKIVARVGLKELVEEIRKQTSVHIRYFDLREERWYYREGIITAKKKLAGDPLGYIQVNLKEDSEFYGKKNKAYYGADYDMTETARYHNENDNIYVMSKTILDCDVFINLPKLKTHKLGGMTCCLKNLVGTCVIKNSIPHHTVGSPEDGGDKYPRRSKKGQTESRLKGMALMVLKNKNPLINYPFIIVKKMAGLFLGSPNQQVIRNGMWYGNDTIWRSCLDLNKILLYADVNGNMHEHPQRKYFAVVDGILAGEKNGPMEPDIKQAGILIGGFNPVTIDTAAATLMGFNYKKIPTIMNAYKIKKYPVSACDADKIILESNDKKWCGSIENISYERSLQFEPHFGWKGHIENV